MLTYSHQGWESSKQPGDGHFQAIRPDEATPFTARNRPDAILDAPDGPGTHVIGASWLTKTVFQGHNHIIKPYAELLMPTVTVPPEAGGGTYLT